ncbi:MAG: glycosyltransferase family 2 protein [Candidatus Methanoperedens sp.]
MSKSGLSNTPKVTIIILNWNGKEDTIELIKSLDNLTYPNYEILIIDNNSIDGSYNYFKNNYPSIKIIQTGDNFGYAKGNNIGIQESINSGSDYSLIINNDTLVEPEFLDKLIKVYESEKNIGLISPLIYEPSKNSKINKVQFKCQKINWYKGFPENNKEKFINKKFIETELISGACFLVKNEIINTIGFIPTEYFMLWEDLDYSINALKKGYKNLCVIDSVVFHKTSQSLNKINNKRLRYSTRNRFIFLYKYSTKSQFICSSLWFIFIFTPIVFMYFTLKGRKLDFIKFYVYGIIDFISIRM